MEQMRKRAPRVNARRRSPRSRRWASWVNPQASVGSERAGGRSRWRASSLHRRASRERAGGTHEGVAGERAGGRRGQMSRAGGASYTAPAWQTRRPQRSHWRADLDGMLRGRSRLQAQRSTGTSCVEPQVAISPRAVYVGVASERGRSGAGDVLTPHTSSRSRPACPLSSFPLESSLSLSIPPPRRASKLL